MPELWLSLQTPAIELSTHARHTPESDHHVYRAVVWPVAGSNVRLAATNGTGSDFGGEEIALSSGNPLLILTEFP